MRVLITGSSGYLGARISQRLIKGGKHTTLKAARGSGSGSMHFWEREKLHEITRGVECIIHSAGLNAQDCEKSIEDAFTVNVINFERLIKAAIDNGVKKLIYLSTAHVYGELEGNIDETTPLKAVHPYGASKKSAEDVLKYYGKKGGLDFTILRLSNVIGAPVSGNKTCWSLLVNDLCKQIVDNKNIVLKTNGEQCRDFLTMEDFLLALENLLDIKVLNNSIFNIGSQSSMSVFDMAILIRERAKKVLNISGEITVNNDDKSIKKTFNFSNEKFSSDVNFLFKNNIIKEIDEVLIVANEMMKSNEKV